MQDTTNFPLFAKEEPSCLLFTSRLPCEDMVLMDSNESQVYAHLRQSLCEELGGMANTPIQEPAWPILLYRDTGNLY